MPDPRQHAIANALEQDPGHWHMHAGGDTTEQPYACIRLLEVGTPSGRRKVYRVVTWAPASSDRRLVGYRDRLVDACELARKHRQHEISSSTAWIRDHSLATAYGDPQAVIERRGRA